MTYLKEIAARAGSRSREAAGAGGEVLSIKTQFVDGDPSTVVKRLRSPHGDTSAYDEVWIVVDEDGDDRESLLRECARNTTRDQTWTAVVSRPCFEVWLAAHYEPVKRYSTQQDAQNHFRGLVSAETPKKEIPRDFPYDRAEEAVSRSHLPDAEKPEAGALPPSPGSGMPVLLHRLGLVEMDF